MKHLSVIMTLLIAASVFCGCKSNPTSQSVKGIGSECLNRVSANSDQSIQYSNISIDSLLDGASSLDNPYLNVVNTQNRSYTFTYYFMENCCCLEYDVQGVIDDNIIKIQMIVKGRDMCDCMCPYAAEVSFDDLADGVYEVNMYIDSKKVNSTSVEIKDGVNTLITL